MKLLAEQPGPCHYSPKLDYIRSSPLSTTLHTSEALGKKKKALEEAKKVSGIILPLKREGLSLRSICHQLNKNGIRTSRGKDFHPSLVSRMLSVLEGA